MTQITEAKVMEIHQAEDISSYSYDELRDADHWMKAYALESLAKHLMAAGVTKAMREYVMLMCRCHYGSIETDEFLRAHGCYPQWMGGQR